MGFAAHSARAGAEMLAPLDLSDRDIVPGKPAFWRILKGTFQRRAAAPPSGPLLGSWLTPTTDALPKATPRTAAGRLLRRSVEIFCGPHGFSYWDPI